MCVLSHVWFIATPVDKLLCPWDFSDKNTGAGCHFLLLLLLLLLSCFSRVQLCDPTDRSPLGSSVPGILQTRILEQVTISYSRGNPNPGNAPVSLGSPALAGGFFTPGATWETLVFLKKKLCVCVCVCACSHTACKWDWNSNSLEKYPMKNLFHLHLLPSVSQILSLRLTNITVPFLGSLCR